MKPRSLMTLLVGTSLGAGAALSADALLMTPARAEPVRLPAHFNPAQSFAPLVQELSPAVVNIDVSQTIDGQAELDQLREQLPPWFPIPEGIEIPDEVRQGQGSGFLISADGYLLTNNHVIAGADKVTVRLQDEQEFDGTVIGVDDSLDVALVKIESDQPLPYVALGSSSQAAVGDWVVAIGNPFGLSHTVTVGIVSAKGRVIGAGPYDNFIQTDAAINPGNSGGPLFNLNGEVIGINTAINPRAQGVGFSVPIDAITPVLDDLRETGRVSRGWLGVGLQTARDGQIGAVVQQVYPDTPARDAGLKDGDRIIAVGDQEIETSDDLIRAVGAQRAGETIKLTLVRNERTRSLKVTLGARPMERELRAGLQPQPQPQPQPEAAPEPPTEPDGQGPRLGVSMEQMGDALVVTRVFQD
ncbi:MAG: trypsin-like peptidase domain-containing protein, partial [Myxococcota bacterium]